MLTSPEAVSTILVFVTGILFSVAANWLAARRGNKVLVSRISQTNEINVSHHIKPDLEITFHGEPITQLVVNTLEVTNVGSKDLENISFVVTLLRGDSEGISILTYRLKDPLNRMSSSPHIDGFEFKRSFLNRIKAYADEKIELTFITDQRIEFQIKGGGSGWSTEYADKTKKDSRLQSKGVLVGLITPMLIALLLTLLLESADLYKAVTFFEKFLIINLFISIIGFVFLSGASWVTKGFGKNV